MAGFEEDGTRTPQNQARPINKFDFNNRNKAPLPRDIPAFNGADLRQYGGRSPQSWQDTRPKPLQEKNEMIDIEAEIRIPKLSSLNEHRSPSHHDRSPRKRLDEEGLSPEGVLKKRLTRAKESMDRQLQPVSPPPLPRLQKIGFQSDDASLELENTELRAQLHAAKAATENLALALRTEQAKHQDDLESVTDALHREYEQKLHAAASAYQNRLTRRFQNRISELLDMLESEKREKQALIDACDNYFNS